MVQSSKEKMRTVRHQFDYFCKKILHGEKVNYERKMEYRGKHEVSFSQFTQEELGRLTSHPKKSNGGNQKRRSQMSVQNYCHIM